MNAWFYLIIGIAFEVVAVCAWKASDGFTKWLPSSIVIICYILALYFAVLAVRGIPIGTAYAIWSGVVILLVTIFGSIIYRQSPDLPAVIGISLIICGIVVMQLFSKTARLMDDEVDSKQQAPKISASEEKDV